MLMLRAHRGSWLRLFVSILAFLLGIQSTLVPALAAPAADDEIADAFLNRLLDEINARRANLGTQPLTFVPASVNSALDGYFAQAEPAIAWPGPCMHTMVGGAMAWDYVLAAGYGGEPRGEVLACPGPDPYWTPDLTAEQWWESPVHFDVLYADPDANALACSVYGRGPVGRTRPDLFAKKKRNDNDNDDGGSGGRSDGGRVRYTGPSGGGSGEAAMAVICVTLRG
ncbi:MAG: hypothetical protein U0893_25180 [Chloroflexota bacterium]